MSKRFPTPSQIAECGGPCYTQGREACDCGLKDYEPSTKARARAELATPPPEPQEAMIPDQYKGHQLHVYRAGFHAGYKHGLTRAPAALTQPAPPTDEERLIDFFCCWLLFPRLAK